MLVGPTLPTILEVLTPIWTLEDEEVTLSVLEGPAEPESSCMWYPETSWMPLEEAQLTMPSVMIDTAKILPRRGTRVRRLPHWLKDYTS